MINFKLLEYALTSLSAKKGKYIFVTVVLTFLVFLASSVFFITSSLQKEAGFAVSNMPDIVVEKQTAGMKQLINRSRIDRIVQIPGVDYAEPRIWGLYNFEYLRSNLTIVGVDPYSENRSKLLSQVVVGGNASTLLSGNGMVTGYKMAKTLKKIYNSYAYSFQTPNGENIAMNIGGTFRTSSQMISNDTILMNQDIAARILGIPDSKATDLAVYVPNQHETDNVVQKIVTMFPDTVCITKIQMKAAYQNMFDYKKGIFLLLFITCLLTFLIIVYDKMSGLNMEEKKEIAVLKAMGWTVGDVLKVKFYESAAVAVTAFLTGTIFALAYVYLFHAPFLKNVFMGYAYLKPDFNLAFRVNGAPIVTVFLITVPIYLASVIIPSWKSAVTDASESIR